MNQKVKRWFLKVISHCHSFRIHYMPVPAQCNVQLFVLLRYADQRDSVRGVTFDAVRRYLHFHFLIQSFFYASILISSNSNSFCKLIVGSFFGGQDGLYNQMANKEKKKKIHQKVKWIAKNLFLSHIWAATAALWLRTLLCIQHALTHTIRFELVTTLESTPKKNKMQSQFVATKRKKQTFGRVQTSESRKKTKRKKQINHVTYIVQPRLGNPQCVPICENAWMIIIIIMSR